MLKVICDHCGKDITHEQTNTLDVDNCFLLGEKWIGNGCELCNNCWEERKRLHARLDADFLHVVMQNRQSAGEKQTDTEKDGGDVAFVRTYAQQFTLEEMLSRLQSGELGMDVGDYFTTRLKNGMEVDFVCTDKDEHSYRFESRDSLGRYDPMTKIDRFYDAVWAELPDALKDNIMEIVRQYMAPDGELMERKCKLFLPSAAEIFPPDECYGDQGLYEQLEWYKDLHNRVRAYEKGGAADWYWTQSPYSGNTTHWCYVSYYGSAYYLASSTSVAAPVCFRIPRI